MSNNDKQVLLRVEKLSQHFKVGKHVLRAVDEVSFEIRKGEVFSLVGESGCGKTTTGRAIIKLYTPTNGKVFIEDKLVGGGIGHFVRAIGEAKSKLTATKRQLKAQKQEAYQAAGDNASAKAEADKKYSEALAEAVAEFQKIKAENEAYMEEIREAQKVNITSQIQMIFQDPSSSLNPRMTVGEIIAEGLKIRGMKDKKELDERVIEMLGLVGLVPEHASRYPHEFSGGQRQRIGIARAIILSPQILIADEPISALDVSIQAQVITLLKELRQKIGLTILFIAHDISVVKYFSDRIAVMFNGKIMEMTTTDELFARPMHPYTRALLSAVPYPDPHFEKTRKRMVYNPFAFHDYSQQQPTMREIVPGHFILCNDAEMERYKAEYGIE